MEKEAKKSPFGDRVREERKRLGLSQAEVAQLCGVVRETWGKYERGVFELGGAALRAFVEAGADADYIVTGLRSQVFESSINKAAENPLVSPEERMAGVFAALSPTSRQEVLAVALRLRELEMQLERARGK